VPAPPDGALPGQYYHPRGYRLSVERLFDHLRSALGYEVELLHDVHERLAPVDAVDLAKRLEPHKLFFLEDPLAPEDLDWFEMIRAQTSTPIAMGELFNNPNEFVPLIGGRLIDFIRIHMSQVGGLTMARKIAHLCEFFNVRTAWHGPADNSPVGHAANVHLDLVTPNFGIQEFTGFSRAERDVFPGCPELKNGYLWANERPGLGIDVDEKLAARFPITDDPPFDLQWGHLRRRDGTIAKP
jgi:mannonate dehydratase